MNGKIILYCSYVVITAGPGSWCFGVRWSFDLHPGLGVTIITRHHLVPVTVTVSHYLTPCPIPGHHHTGRGGSRRGQGHVIVGGYPRVVVGTGQGQRGVSGHVRVTGSQANGTGSLKVMHHLSKV